MTGREKTHYPSPSLNASFSTFLRCFGGTFLMLRLSLSRCVTSSAPLTSSAGVLKYLVNSGWGGPRGWRSKSSVKEAWKIASLIR